jgi:predicted dehydrogenase
VVKIVSGAELKKELLNNVSSKWGFNGYTDFEKMIRKEDLDIVAVTTGPRYTRKITERAAEHGVNVLVEKPISLTVEDAKAMIRKCEKEGVKLFYGESFRFFPTIEMAKELIDESLLGDLQLLFEFFIGGQGSENFQPYEIYADGDPGLGPMGLMDHGIHLVDIFRWFTGCNVEWVFGKGSRAGQPPQSEFLTIKYESGTIGQLVYNEATYPSDMPNEGIFSWGAYFAGGTSSWEAHPSSIRIHGSKGALRIFPYANKMFLFNKNGQRQIRVKDTQHPYHFGRQIDSFADSIIGDEEPKVTGMDGLKALQTILAAYESYETSKIIRIEGA